MRALAGIWVILAKEVVDNLRDGRSLTMAAVYPLMGPLLLGLLLAFAQAMFRPDQSGEASRLRLAIHGLERAPGLAEYLEERGIVVIPAAADLHYDVRDGDLDFGIIIPEDYSEDFSAERPAAIQMVMDATRLSAVLDISRAIEAIRRYGNEVSAARLATYGLSEGVVQPITIDTINVGRTRNLAAFLLNMIPPFVIFTIFIGGVYLALDTTSGERERGSLEPLLINPLARWQFMLGKVGAAFVYTMVALIIQLLAFMVMFEIVVDEQFALNINPSADTFVKVFLVSLPMMLFAVSLQVIVASMTHSFKETQTYLGLLPLIPSVPGMVLIFVSVKSQAWMTGIPTFAQVVQIGEIVRGDPVSLDHVLLAAGVTIVVSALLLCVAGRLYSREQLLFGT